MCANNQHTSISPSVNDELLWMEKTINEFYPQLFDQCCHLSEKLRSMQVSHDVAIITQLWENACSEIDTLYRKEKFVLFPYIRSLITLQKKSEHCAPFKNVKQHYTAALEIMVNVQKLTAEPEETLSDSFAILSSALIDIRNNIISIQREKEQHIFKTVRSCAGCKIISQ